MRIHKTQTYKHGYCIIILLYRTRLGHDIILCGLLSNFAAILYRWENNVIEN